VTADAKACGACGATSSPQWWQAEPRLCGHDTLCHACHTKIRDALVDLVANARRLPMPVLIEFVSMVRELGDKAERMRARGHVLQKVSP